MDLLAAVVVDFLVAQALMTLQIDFEAHLRSLPARASPTTSLLGMEEVGPQAQWLFSQLSQWKIMNMNKFHFCRHLLAVSWTYGRTNGSTTFSTCTSTCSTSTTCTTSNNLNNLQ